jgi:uncharacterized protein (TIGR03435 family)
MKSLRPAVLVCVLALAAEAQTPAFEVASVRRSQAGATRPSVRRDPAGGITALNVSLRWLITMAYNIQDFQLSGAPAWIASEHYDVIAKAPERANRADTWRMLQALLAERFRLAVRRETRELPVYELVVAKDGPKFHEAERAPTETDGSFRVVNGHLKILLAPMSDVALILAGIVGRPVVDRTGIAGKFDLELDWAPNSRKNEGGPDPVFDRPTIFAALPEQLGLKLEAAKGPVDVLVVDHVERAFAN